MNRNLAGSNNIKNVDNIYSRKILMIFGFVGVLALVSINIYLLYNKIEAFFTGTKWANSGMSLVMVIQDTIHNFFGYFLFAVIAIFIIRAYFKINNLNISNVELINTILIFLFILNINGVFKILLSDNVDIIPDGINDIKVLFNKLKDLKGFATGLDMLIPLEGKSNILISLIQCVNVFSITGFAFLVIRLRSWKENSLWINIILICVFVLMVIAVSAVDLSNFVTWTD